MARIKLFIPDKSPLFTSQIKLRVTDMNYGNHLGNDRLLVIAQEARMEWLNSMGYTELEIGGIGLIMADAAIVYKAEGHYGEILAVALFCEDITEKSFDLFFKITTIRNQAEVTIALVKTGMLGFDYQKKKVTSFPQNFKKDLKLK